MTYLFKFMLATSLLVLSACGQSAAPTQGVLTSGQKKVLTDAKGVEKELLDADQAQRKELDKAAQ
ncbi:MAG TPA: hypothetical protein VIZ65_05255 [Cellvibrionaceae bacterium]